MQTGGNAWSSEWSTKTTKCSGGTCFKGHVAAVMDYALWAISKGVYKPMDFDIDIDNDNETFSSH